MNEVLTELIARLGQKVPELRLIDEDYGQLEPNPGDQYPVVFPCVLLSTVGVEWADMGIPGPNVQRGTAEITVRLAIDCYDDTHAGSGTTDRIAARAQLNRRVVKALHGYRPKGSIGPMSRVRSDSSTTVYNWKIYETTFRWIAKDDLGKPE